MNADAASLTADAALLTFISVYLRKSASRLFYYQYQWLQSLSRAGPRRELGRTLPRPRTGGPSATLRARLRTGMGAASAGNIGSTEYKGISLRKEA